MTAAACNEWRETCDQEKEHRRRSQARLGIKLSPRAKLAPVPGTMRSPPPTSIAHLFDSPRSTAKDDTRLAKPPGALSLGQFVADPSDAPVKAHNRQKIMLDYNFERGDHQIFPPVGPLEDPRQGRQRIRELKAQVSQEKAARRDAESRLQWHQEFSNDRECTIEALVRKYAVPKRLLDAQMPSPRIATLADPLAAAVLQSPCDSQQPVGFAWISQATPRPRLQHPTALDNGGRDAALHLAALRS